MEITVCAKKSGEKGVWEWVKGSNERISVRKTKRWVGEKANIRNSLRKRKKKKNDTLLQSRGQIVKKNKRFAKGDVPNC